MQTLPNCAPLPPSEPLSILSSLHSLRLGSYCVVESALNLQSYLCSLCAEIRGTHPHIRMCSSFFL